MNSAASGNGGCAARRHWLRALAGLGLNPLVMNAVGMAAGGSASAEVIPPQIELVYLANRQRTALHRIARLYAQILVGARAGDARRLLQDALVQFETLHSAHKDAQFRSGSANVQIDLALKRVGSDWLKFRALASATPAVAGLQNLAGLCDGLTQQVNQGAGPSALFLSSSTVGQLVDRSGKLCLLSQQMAKCYFFRALGFRVDEASRQIAEAHAEFEENSNALKKAPENSGEINSLLLLASTQWPYFDEAVGRKERNAAAGFDYNVATTAENMFEVLSRLNLLYFRLLGA